MTHRIFFDTLRSSKGSIDRDARSFGMPA